MASGAFNSNSSLSKAGPAAKPRKKSFTLRQLQQSIYDLAIHQSKIARVCRNRTVSNRIQDSVEAKEQQSLYGVLFAIESLSVDDVGTLLPLFQKTRNGARIILKIRVHHDHDITGRMLKTRVNCRLMAEVSRQMNDDNPTVG
jgi:hypothetical protein